MSTWVLLRGLAREARHWGDFPQTFQATLGDVDLVLPDLAGNGALFQERSPARIEDMVEHYRSYLRAAGVVPPYCLLALSLGGMVAVDWSQRYPAELQALVLINTSLRPLNPWYWRLRPRSWFDLLRVAVVAGEAEKLEATVYRLTSQRPERQERTIQSWAAHRRQCPVAIGNALRQLVAAWRYLAPRRTPVPPLLFLASADDHLVDPRCSQQLASIWQADLVMHENAGHDLPLDDPSWVAKSVRDWLEKLDSN